MEKGDRVMIAGDSPRNWNKTWWNKLSCEKGTIKLIGEEFDTYLVEMDDPSKRSWWFIREELILIWRE